MDEAEKQAWEEERARLTAERDEAQAEAAKPELVRWAGYRQALEERDALRLRLEKVEPLIASVLQHFESGDHGDREDVCDFMDGWLQDAEALPAWRNRDSAE